jgi:predicted dehydrogenase
MIERGEFGRIVLVRMVYFSWFAPEADDPKRWRVLRDRSGGGPISDMGSHMFDVLIGLLGMPVKVYARCANLVHQWEVEDTASIVMELPDGAQVTAVFAWNSKTWRHEFEIVGTEAKVCWHPYDAGQVIKTAGRQVDELALPPAENVHLPLVEDFVRAVLEDRSPVCPLTEAAKTNALLDAVYRSAAAGRETRV